MVNPLTPGPGPSLVPHAISPSPTSVQNLYNTFKLLYNSMVGDPTNFTCLSNCSGRGECLDGTCVCPVQYEGLTCREPNLAYFISFATVFYLIAAVSLAQLLICIHSEYCKMKTPSLYNACKITTQKVLYVNTSVAAILRGAYFSSPANADLTLANIFMSAFYPIILTAGSLIVCFWAEAFHLRDIRCDRPRFLGKSFGGFFTFNVITYALFAAEVILTKGTASEDQRDFLSHIFNGCYAVLLFIVVVFFLIYGVEVYFKVRGGFVSDTLIVGHVHSRPSQSSEDQSNPPLLSPDNVHLESSSPIPSNSQGEVVPTIGPSEEQEVESSVQLLPDQQKRGEFVSVSSAHGIDQSQLQQSRFGLVFQACMLMITVCFLFSDVLGQFWKSRVPLISRNAYDIIFRVVELGVALWFPCVLWNCISPEQLWILNPKKILRHLEIERTIELGQSATRVKKDDTTSEEVECWICYDSDRTDAGPLIQPCDCRGDVGYVHHDCLRKWLMECAENEASERLSCKVCGAAYSLERSQAWWIGQGFTTRHWLQTASLVTVMCGTIASSWAIIQMYENAFIRSVTAGSTLLILYVCMRFLGFNTFTAYQRARFSAVKIISRHLGLREGNSSSTPSGSSDTNVISTISSDVRVHQNPRSPIRCNSELPSPSQVSVCIGSSGLPIKLPQTDI